MYNKWLYLFCFSKHNSCSQARKSPNDRKFNNSNGKVWSVAGSKGKTFLMLSLSLASTLVMCKTVPRIMWHDISILFHIVIQFKPIRMIPCCVGEWTGKEHYYLWAFQIMLVQHSQCFEKYKCARQRRWKPYQIVDPPLGLPSC